MDILGALELCFNSSDEEAMMMILDTGQELAEVNQGKDISITKHDGQSNQD
jgi:hypothetical protein